MSGDSCHDRESAEGRDRAARFTPSTPRPVAVRIEWEDHACGLTINDCPECQTRYRRLMDETLELVKQAFARLHAAADREEQQYGTGGV